MLCRSESLSYPTRAGATVALGIHTLKTKFSKRNWDMAHPGGDEHRAYGLRKPHSSLFVHAQAPKLTAWPSHCCNRVQPSQSEPHWVPVEVLLAREGKPALICTGSAPTNGSTHVIDRQDGFSVSEEWFCLSFTAHG